MKICCRPASRPAARSVAALRILLLTAGGFAPAACAGRAHTGAARAPATGPVASASTAREDAGSDDAGADSESARSPAASSPDALPALLKQIEAAYRGGEYARGLSLVQRALQLNRGDVSSLDRIGSIYFVLGRYGEAITIWRRALPYERDLRRRRELENSIAVARRSLGIAVDESAPAAVPVRAPRPRRVPVAAAQPPPPPDPALIAKLYKKGVKYYAEGEYLQAAATFLRILDLEPGNPEATKALERLKLEPGGGASAAGSRAEPDRPVRASGDESAAGGP